MGRSRGGLPTKIHVAVDGRSLPLSIVLTPGNDNDCTAFPRRPGRARRAAARFGSSSVPARSGDHRQGL
ncbi:transposase [Actinomadura nitritigenes]|uniref:transposase n=1 Tax=Actinomadura nitritigenes TaxID=134602 RepID=UPI003D90454A